MPHLIYPFLCWWTSRLLLRSDYCKWYLHFFVQLIGSYPIRPQPVSNLIFCHLPHSIPASQPFTPSTHMHTSPSIVRFPPGSTKAAPQLVFSELFRKLTRCSVYTAVWAHRTTNFHSTHVCAWLSCLPALRLLRV